MHIALYTYTSNIFGRLCRSWKRHLEARGYVVTYVTMPMSFDPAPPPVVRGVDLNLYVAGFFILIALKNHGYPENGAPHALWMYDPIPSEDEVSENHRRKADLFRAIGGELSAMASMNRRIAQQAASWFPRLEPRLIPFTVDADEIVTPMPEVGRVTDVLMLGLSSRRRERAHARFEMQVRGRHRFIFGNLFDEKRFPVLETSKVSLNLHRDEHAYLAQPRVWESIACGAPVLTEPPGDDDPLSGYGLEAGEHLAVAEWDALTDAAEELLRDRPARERLTANAQALLRERYTPEAWIESMEAFLHSARG